MHEMAIISYVVDQMDSFAERTRVKEIQTVVLQIGALTGVIPEFVRECWTPAVHFSKHLQKSNVEIEEIPAKGRCKECGIEYDLQEYEGICPECISNQYEVLSGEEMLIKEVKIAESDIMPREQTMGVRTNG